MNTFLTLLLANLKLEFRVRETMLLLLSLVAMLSVIFSLGIGSAFIDPSVKLKIFPALLWILFLVAATVSVGRSFEYEGDLGALEGLLLTGISIPLIYLAKVVSNCIILLVGQGFSFLFLSMFMNVEVPNAEQLIPVFVAFTIGYSALATLLSGVTHTTKLKQILLPIILLPLLVPLFLCAIEMTYGVVLEGAAQFGASWFIMIIGLDLLYLVLGTGLFEAVIRE